MRKELEQLHASLEEEFERQSNVLAVCAAQGHAARAHDLELLEAKTSALNALLRDFVAAEAERVRRAKDAAKALGLAETGCRLSDLIAAAPEPWQGRLAESRARLRTTLKEIRRAVAQNNEIIRRSLNIVSDALDSLVECFPAPPGGQYNARGSAGARRIAQASVLDHKG